PGAAAAQQSAQDWQRHTVDKRRPDELETAGQAREREQADRVQRNARLAQPARKSGKVQRKGQPGRETEKQHAGDGGLAVGDQRAAPAPGLGRGLAQPRRLRTKSSSLAAGRAPTCEMISAAAMAPTRPARARS